MPPTKTTSSGCVVGAQANAASAAAVSRTMCSGVGGSAVDDPARQATGADLDPGCAGGPARADLDHLARAAADVDDQEIAPDGAAGGQPDERQERLLLVLEDGQRNPRAGGDLGDDPGRVGEAPQRLGAEDDRIGDARRAGPVHVGGDRRDERRPTTGPEGSGPSTAAPRPRNVDSSSSTTRPPGSGRATRRWTEVEPRSIAEPGRRGTFRILLDPPRDRTWPVWRRMPPTSRRRVRLSGLESSAGASSRGCRSRLRRRPLTNDTQAVDPAPRTIGSAQTEWTCRAAARN